MTKKRRLQKQKKTKNETVGRFIGRPDTQILNFMKAFDEKYKTKFIIKCVCNLNKTTPSYQTNENFI